MLRDVQRKRRLSVLIIEKLHLSVSKVMLKIVQRRITPTVESVLDDCQAGFTAGRRTAKQVTNHRILCEKYIEHGSKVFLNFVDYRKEFDRVWHYAIWAELRNYGIDENITRALEQLYAKSTSKARIGTKFREKFLCSVGVRQGCVLSPNLSNVFLEGIGSKKVEELTGGVCVQGLLVNNLRFADDIALITDNSMNYKTLPINKIQSRGDSEWRLVQRKVRPL